MTADDYPQKITFGEMRASGVRDVLVYCRDHRCSHHIAISADLWPLAAPKNKSLARSNKTAMRCSGSNASPARISQLQQVSNGGPRIVPGAVTNFPLLIAAASPHGAPIQTSSDSKFLLEYLRMKSRKLARFRVHKSKLLDDNPK